MSTVSSVLNSLATVTIADLYQRPGRPEASVKFARVVTCGFGVIGTILACFGGAFGNVLEASMTISNFFGGSLVGVFLLGMLSRRANAIGALVGMAGGLTVVVSVSALSSVAGMWFGAISSLSAYGIGYVASLLTRAPPPESGAFVVGGLQGKTRISASAVAPVASTALHRQAGAPAAEPAC
jgi:Na+/proline symporter